LILIRFYVTPAPPPSAHFFRGTRVFFGDIDSLMATEHHHPSPQPPLEDFFIFGIIVFAEPHPARSVPHDPDHLDGSIFFSSQ